jgi:tRNA (Thr-GGU) A37 N-methylase
MDYSMRAIAYIRNERSEALDDNWGDVVSMVELAQDVPDESLHGLAAFSHVELIFFADWAVASPPPGQRRVARRGRLRAAQQGSS